MSSSQHIPQRDPAGSTGRVARLAVLSSQAARAGQLACAQFYERTFGALIGGTRMQAGLVRFRGSLGMAA